MENKHYWRSLGERERPDKSGGDGDTMPHGVPGEDFAINLSRRDFLKATGFFLGAAALSSCGRGPVNEVVSRLAQPEEIVPGRAYWRASTCLACEAGCGVLVKNRDGRPLKLEGNPEHPVSRGGLCAVAQASVLGLYDDRRLKGPLAAGSAASWNSVDADILRELDAIRRKGGAVRVLSRTITSPTLKAVVDKFLGRFGGKLVVYDPLPASAMLDAHERAFGARVLPRLRFERAGVIASFDADFLSAWISPVEFSAGYRAGRSLEGKLPRLSRHIQFEPRLSLTGANADLRITLGPREVSAALATLARDLARRAGLAEPPGPPPPCPVAAEELRAIADELWSARGRSLVVCGVNDLPSQLLAVLANSALGNYGKTLDLNNPSWQRRGDDAAAKALLVELSSGKVDALFVLDADPAAELPDPGLWREALKKTPLLVSCARHSDETAALARYVCPDRHPLEAWADCEAVAGVVSTAQPAIEPLGDTRPVVESLSAWLGVERSDTIQEQEGGQAYDLIREHWRAEIFPRRKEGLSFDDFWNKAVHDGFTETAPAAGRPPAGGDTMPHGVPVGDAFGAAVLPLPPSLSVPSAFSLQPSSFPPMALTFYAKTGMLDGRHSNNPWLHELPDPVTKIVWDNYACLSTAAARSLGLAEGEIIKLSSAIGGTLELPVHIQPGQHDGTAAVALGYGRRGTERFSDAGPQWLGAATVAAGERVGCNAAALLAWPDGRVSGWIGDVTISKTGRKAALACTQEYHSLKLPERLASRPGETRPFIKETAISEYRKNPSAGNEPERKHESLWPAHVYEGRRWGMAIDLGACTGCSACVISCQAENNIPVVGRDEVGRRRDMHWLRIDRYYGDTLPQGVPGVDVVFQPMLCQHCGNAPCETVCPVLATMHSEEGLNQQIYNRCVGTRYCENNCPYKARRFNWFQYQKEGRLANLALNPDVTARTRGVMEKCTFCVQRIQEAKFEAARQGRPLRDGDIRPACAQSCPAQAIVFGDMNDPASRVSQMRKDPRHYRVLADLNVEPSVGYMVKVRNRAGDGGGPEHV